MSEYAGKVIKEIYYNAQIESGEQYSTVTVRLAPEEAIMLKAMAKGLDFSVSTVFTDILNHHLFDFAVSLTDEDFDEVTKSFRDKKQRYFTKKSALTHLIEKGLIPKFDWDGYNKEQAKLIMEGLMESKK